jgi:hypothetical protein
MKVHLAPAQPLQAPAVCSRTTLMTPAAFVTNGSRVDLPERAASQEHFIDLCRLLGQPTPAEHDATGGEYALEKGVEVAGGARKGAKGDRGFADVWWKGKFGWEHKPGTGPSKTPTDSFSSIARPWNARQAVFDPARSRGATYLDTCSKQTSSRRSPSSAELADPRSLA